MVAALRYSLFRRNRRIGVEEILQHIDVERGEFAAHRGGCRTTTIRWPSAGCRRLSASERVSEIYLDFYRPPDDSATVSDVPFGVCRCSSMVELLLPKQTARVRFPSSARTRLPATCREPFLIRLPSPEPLSTSRFSRSDLPGSTGVSVWDGSTEGCGWVSGDRRYSPPPHDISLDPRGVQRSHRCAATAALRRTGRIWCQTSMVGSTKFVPKQGISQHRQGRAGNAARLG